MALDWMDKRRDLVPRPAHLRQLEPRFRFWVENPKLEFHAVKSENNELMDLDTLVQMFENKASYQICRMCLLEYTETDRAKIYGTVSEGLKLISPRSTTLYSVIRYCVQKIKPSNTPVPNSMFVQYLSIL